MKKMISRRNFLKAAGVSAAALGLAACGGSSRDVYKRQSLPSVPMPKGPGRLNTGIRMPHARILEPSLSC